MIIQASSPLIQSQEQVSAGGAGGPTVKASLDEGGPHMVGVTGDRGGRSVALHVGDRFEAVTQ